MEWWEGAIVIVGGIWLIGRVSRHSPTHPVNSVPLSLNGGTARGLNPTTATNMDGSDTLIAGEPFNPGGVSSGATIGGSGTKNCCGGGGLPSIVGSQPPGGGMRIVAGASTGTPRQPVMVPRTGPIPIRQIPVTQQPARRTSLSPAASAPRQPVRFYTL